MIYLIRSIFISKLRFSPSYTTVHLYEVLKGEVRFHQNVNWEGANDDDEISVHDNLDDNDIDNDDDNVNDNNDCDNVDEDNVDDDDFLTAEVYFPTTTTKTIMTMTMMMMSLTTMTKMMMMFSKQKCVSHQNVNWKIRR